MSVDVRNLKVTRDLRVLRRDTGEQVARLRPPPQGGGLWGIVGEAVGYKTRRDALREIAFRLGM